MQEEEEEDGDTVAVEFRPTPRYRKVAQADVAAVVGVVEQAMS